MKAHCLRRIGLSGMTLLLGLALSGSAFAVGGEHLPQNPPPPPTTSDQKPAPKQSKDKKKEDRRSQRDFIDGYNAARQLVRGGHYEAAIVAFTALDADDDPDVANYLGFAHRKAGRYAQSQVWYEKALAADPAHTRTWQYYGMWHLENGNALKAQDHLEKIRLICGTTCEDYRLLREAIVEGKTSY